MKQIDKKFFEAAKLMADIDANHYPERMGVTLIVNAPRTFTAVWSVVEPWLDENTANKIILVSGVSNTVLAGYTLLWLNSTLLLFLPLVNVQCLKLNPCSTILNVCGHVLYIILLSVASPWS